MTTELDALWAPIVLSAVVVFIASNIAWMVLPHHKGEWKKPPNEDALLDLVRSGSLAPGQYGFPGCADWSDMKKPEFKERYARGPWGVLTVFPGPMNMGRSIGIWIAYLLVVSLFVAYITANALAPGAEYMRVFRVAGAAAVGIYALAPFCESIWKGAPWNATIKTSCDGLAYGLLTAGCFAWLWPNGAAAVLD